MMHPDRDRSGSTILIADDEEANLRLLERILRRAGYHSIHGTTDSRRVPEMFRELAPDLLLLDLHMPHADGFETMRRLEPLVGPSEYFPILMLSGDLRSEVKNAALEHGARDFLTKPFDAVEVLLRIGNLLQSRFLHQALQRNNLELEAKVRERTQELEDAQVEILERLARVSEFQDRDTGEHIRRVSRLAALLAAELGLPGHEVDLIRRASILHDVGKVGIPGAIHLKPGRLTSDEFAAMATHTTLGAAILSDSRFAVLQKAEEIALTHHERWDGTGYPRGLAGEEIPIAGRVVAAADVFDALTHSRSYKAAWTVDDTLAEIEAGSGSHFDPAVVRALAGLHGTGLLAELAAPSARVRRIRDRELCQAAPVLAAAAS